MASFRQRWQSFWNPNIETKFTPADPTVNWRKIETLVHGPGASSSVSEGDANSAVFACLMAVAMGYVEPPPRVFNFAVKGRETWVEDHPLQDLLDTPFLPSDPTQNLSQSECLFWTQWAKHTDGNAYWMKIRADDYLTGPVIGLQLVSPVLMSPVTLRNSRDFISYYALQVAPGVFESVPTQNVVHFRLGLDPKDLRVGLSPLKRLVRQIATDNEADIFTEALLKNFAVPGLVVITKDTNLDQDSADLIKARMQNNFGNDGRGNVGVLSNEAKVEQFGFSPSQLDLGALHRVPEERIAAVLRVPPLVAHLGAGLETATYSNYVQAREAFTEDTLVPLWRTDAATLNRQLKPDFTSDPKVKIVFDLRGVRSLQIDEDKHYIRLNLGVQGGWITPNEARAEVGLPTIAGGDELRVASSQAIGGDQTGQPNEVVRANNLQPGSPNTAQRVRRNGVGENKELPPVLRAALTGSLEAVTTAEDALQVYADIWRGYP